MKPYLIKWCTNLGGGGVKNVQKTVHMVCAIKTLIGIYNTILAQSVCLLTIQNMRMYAKNYLIKFEFFKNLIIICSKKVFSNEPIPNCQTTRMTYKVILLIELYCPLSIFKSKAIKERLYYLHHVHSGRNNECKTTRNSFNSLRSL